MENPNICPFCGGNPLKKNPYSDRIKEIEVGGGVGGASAKGNAKIKPNPHEEEYYRCNGCNQEYVWAPIDIHLIIEHLLVEDNIITLINHYYGDHVSLTDLLTKYRTGIIRRRNTMIPYISNMIARRQLYICFNYKNKRTFAAFVRKKGTKYHYIMKTMEIPKL